MTEAATFPPWRQRIEENRRVAGIAQPTAPATPTAAPAATGTTTFAGANDPTAQARLAAIRAGATSTSGAPGAPGTAGAVTAPPVPPAPPANQAITGIAPLSSVNTTQELPELQDADTVAILNSLTSQDSDLMKQARTAGYQQANARGVMNSSIGIGAAQNEQLKAAVPIALQEAMQRFQSNQQRYDLAAQMARLKAQAGFEQIGRAEGYAYTSSLNTQGYAFQAQQQKNQQQFQKDMAAVQQGYAVDMANLQATLQSKLQSQANDEQIQRMGVEFQNNMALQAEAAKNTLDQIRAQGDVQLTLQANQFEQALKELTLQLNSQNSIAMANAAVNLFQAEQQLRAALLANPNMPAAERAAYEKQITALTAPVQAYVNGVLGYAPTGGTPPAAGTPPATPPAGTPPAGTPPGGAPAPAPPSGGIAPQPSGGGTPVTGSPSGFGSAPVAAPAPSPAYGGIAPVTVSAPTAPTLSTTPPPPPPGFVVEGDTSGVTETGVDKNKYDAYGYLIV